MTTTRKLEPVIVPDDFSIDEAILHADLIGVTPLLMHSTAGMGVKDDAVKKAKKEIPLPADEAERSTYRMPTGELYMPVQNVYRAIMEAGAKIGNPDNKRATMKKPLSAALLPPAELGWKLIDPDTGELLTDYEVDVRRVMVQRQGVMRARPRFDRWALHVEIHYDQAVLTDPRLIATALATAGQVIGIGDFRPEKGGGSFGRFTATNIAVDR